MFEEYAKNYMRRPWLPLAVVLTAATGLVTPTDEAKARTVLASSAGPASTVSSYAGTAVWSQRSNGRWHLWAADATIARRLPVRSSPRPFDAGIGPNGSGRPVVTYSRCRVEAPDALRRRGCDVYMYDLRRRTEDRLRRGSTARFAEFSPTRWRDQLVVARRPETGGRRRVEIVRIPLAGTRRVSRLGSGTVANTGRPSDAEPVTIDTDGRHVVWDWWFEPRQCAQDRPDDLLGRGRATEIWLTRLDGRSSPRRVETACSYDDATGPLDVSSPSLSRGVLSYSRFFGPPPDGSRIRRINLVTGAVTNLAYDDTAYFMAADADRFWLAGPAGLGSQMVTLTVNELTRRSG